MPDIAIASSVVRRLAARNSTRTEADLQADIYAFLTAGGLSLSADQVAHLEVSLRDGTRRRLDIEVGNAVIEVKKNLSVPSARKVALEQLAGYVADRTREVGNRYVGILTDGVEWILYHLDNGTLSQVDDLRLSGSEDDTERLRVWLEAILATEKNIKPTPQEIARRLGAESSAYRLDHATLTSLYRANADLPEVSLKRQLWAKLLRTSFGKAFSDKQNLFIDHTLLVLTAEMIAHAVVGFDLAIGGLSPKALVRGNEFANAQIYGVVESDFFDWVLSVEGGPEFVDSLAKRIARFDWNQVEHDVLKVLYESIIAQDERTALGEYYTPDWLADRMVHDAITDPLNQKVLDPACGSGTFLFHAIRAYLKAAEEANTPTGAAVSGLTSTVYGIDVHPVAVTLARVTYLLAIGHERLNAPDRGPISIPVYLGDSIQWEQRTDLLGGIDNITISTRGDDIVDIGSGTLFGDDLIFPRSVLAEVGDFDRLVTAMANKAIEPSSRSAQQLMRPILRQFGVPVSDHSVLIDTFATIKRLHESGRNHIWGYYVRNLIRPIWMSEEENRVDVLIGNPPWLRYNKMTSTMQDRYKVLCKERQLLKGKLGASARDLSTLFVVRAVELYLRPGGKFSFVMPHGVLTRNPHEGFRSGKWSSSSGTVICAAFEKPWDLAGVNPTGFPMTAAVVRGTRTVDRPSKMPTATIAWKGRLPKATVGWDVAKERLTLTDSDVVSLSSTEYLPASPYRSRFRQGAILVPRRLMFVVDGPVNPLGTGAGRISVTSRVTSGENAPWRDVAPITATVERSFVRPVYLGETVLPFRVINPLRAVLPITDEGILSEEELESYPGLATWWNAAEDAWGQHRVPSETAPLLKRFDYHNQLSAQLPSAQNRVVYTKSANRLAAARITDPRAVIDHTLYWAATNTTSEGRYLVGILNSSAIMTRVRPLMAIGLFGPRHIDKMVFRLPIPAYDSANSDHVELVELVELAENIAADIDLSESRDFKRSRALVREAIEKSGLTNKIDSLVERIVPEVSPNHA